MSDVNASERSARCDKEWIRGASQTIRHPLTRALLVLTFSTGLVDSVSYLGLGRVFTANMTGNIVLLGFGVAGGVGLPVVAPLVWCRSAPFSWDPPQAGRWLRAWAVAIRSMSPAPWRSRSP
jgi:hypothetical protein